MRNAMSQIDKKTAKFPRPPRHLLEAVTSTPRVRTKPSDIVASELSRAPQRERRYRIRIANAAHLGPWTLGPGKHCVGRVEDCDIAIEDSTISRHHLEIEILPGDGVVVRDLGSTNGSWLGDHQVERARVFGDFALRIGAVELEFKELSDVEEVLRQGPLDCLATVPAA